MKESLQSRGLNHDAAAELSYVIRDYSHAITTLDAYDRKALKVEQTTAKRGHVIDYKNASVVIAQLKKELIKKKQASDLFGKEREKRNK